MIAKLPELSTASAWLQAADGLLITAGAGMGIDSGLPDFRGPGGFWKAYPALGQARIPFESIANPHAFVRDPLLAWGFYGHRLQLYRHTEPHDGFRILRDIAACMPRGAWVMTSNVDGQFQKAGFSAERVCEIHGSIHHLQCMDNCRGQCWSASGFVPDIDAERCRLLSDLPLCPHCASLARPNILMFGDGSWEERRTALQYRRLMEWLPTVKHLVCVEIGAGTHIPTIRHFSESCGGHLIRINPDEADTPAHGVGLACGGRAGLAALHAELSESGYD